MIRSATGDAYISIQNIGSSEHWPYVQPAANPMQGSLRINGSMLEVFDSLGWKPVATNHINISINAPYREVLDWAMKKMNEEQTLREHATKYPAVKIAVDNVITAQKQLDIIMKLTKENE